MHVHNKSRSPGRASKRRLDARARRGRLSGRDAQCKDPWEQKYWMGHPFISRDFAPHEQDLALSESPELPDLVRAVAKRATPRL